MMFRLSCLSCFLAPLGEGAFQLSALAVFVGLVLERMTGASKHNFQLPVNQKTRDVLVLWLIWCGIGLVSALWQGREPRFSHMSQLTMSWAGLIGYGLVGRFSKQENEALCSWFAGGVLFSASLGLSQYLFGTFPGEDILRGSRGYMGQLLIPGSGGERAAAGAYLNRLKLSEAMMVALAVLGACRMWQWSQRVSRLAILCLPLAVLALVLSFSKAAWLGAAVVIVLAALTHYRLASMRLISVAMFLSVVGGVITAAYAGYSLPSWDVLPGVDSWNIRRWIWKHAVAVWADHPWFGCGMGTYAAVASSYFNPEVFNWVHASTAHQHHLTAFVEGGLVGGFAWLTLMGAVGRVLIAVWDRELSGGRSAARFSATAILVAMLAFSFFHSVFYHPVTGLYIWGAVGILCALENTTGSEQSSTLT